MTDMAFQTTDNYTVCFTAYADNKENVKAQH